MRKRISKALRAQINLPKGEAEARGRPFTILVAVSGGKDSALMLAGLVDLIGARRDVEIVAGIVDEGIEGYRAPSIDCAEELCGNLDVRLERISYIDLGFAEMDDVVERMNAIGSRHTEAEGLLPCSYCGVFRRRGIDALATRLEADWVAIGHNLDDVAQSVLMNLQKGDVERTVRLAPHTEQPIQGLAPRIVPLRWVPEREVHAVALHLGLPFHHGDCPHALGALRQRSRAFIAALEADVPGSRHGLVHALDRLKEMHGAILESGNRGTREAPGRCSICSEVTSRIVCQACTMKSWLEEE